MGEQYLNDTWIELLLLLFSSSAAATAVLLTNP